jgi:hypothetical protein
MHKTLSRQGALLTLAALAAAAGLLATGPALVDPELVMLLRFMAVLKAAMAIGALVLVAWRLRRPAGPALAASGIASVAFMAAGAGLIWSLGHVALGAVLFHAGLFTLLVAAWRDGLPWPRRLMLPQRATTGTATSFLRRNGSVQGGS